MYSAQNRTKDYSDDWDAFTRGLKAKSTLDLTYYARNLVSSAARIDGDDDFANALFEKLTKRARLCNEELARRGTYNAPKSTMAERKRRIEELTAQLPVESQAPAPSTGATYRDGPIPSRPSPLVPSFTPSPNGHLYTDERLEEEEEEEPEMKKFKVSFEEESQQRE